jgi:hypothetical protein
MVGCIRTAVAQTDVTEHAVAGDMAGCAGERTWRQHRSVSLCRTLRSGQAEQCEGHVISTKTCGRPHASASECKASAKVPKSSLSSSLSLIPLSMRNGLISSVLSFFVEPLALPESCATRRTLAQVHSQ